MKKSLIAVALLAVASSSMAQFEVREMSLNGPGYGDNVKVVPMDTLKELKNHKFSYDPDEINFNHQYKGAKHAIDRLSLGDQTKILLFIHNAVIEKRLAPNTVPSGEVSLDVILKKSPYKVGHIKTKADVEKFIRQAYQDKLNSMVNVQGVSKSGNFIQMQADNHTDFKISKVTGNLKVANTMTKTPLMDAMVTEYGMGFAAGTTTTYTLNMPSRVEGWYHMKDNLGFNFTVHEIEFSNGDKFNADKFYLDIKSRLQTLDPYPFTEI